MSIEPTDTPSVDVNTDDLDAFSDLLTGKAKAEVKEAPAKEEVKSDEVDTVAETETNEQAPEKDDAEDTPDEDIDPEDQPEEKPKKTNRFQERINELTAKAKEAERREADLQRKLEEIAAKQNPGPKAAAPTEALKLPNADAKNEDGSDKYPLGEFDPGYIRDLNRAIIEEERKSIREREEQEANTRRAQEVRNALQEQWVEKLNPVIEQHEDFLDKTLQLEATFDGLDQNYSDYLVQTIKSLDHGPEVLYYFANNPDEARKVVQSGPLGATLALGEINAMFKGQGRKETKVSKAPPPPQVNTKGNNARKTVAPDTDDLDAFSDVFFPTKKKR